MELAFRVLLGGIFLAASISKILDLSGFVSTVVGYDLIPRTLAEIYGWVIPWFELYLGCSLILGVLPRISAGLSIPLTLSFAIASSYALEKFPDSTCGCFGNFIALSHPVSLAVDGIMFLLAMAILANKQPEFLSIGQLLDHLKPGYRNKSLPRYYASLIGLVALAVLGMALISYGVESLTSRAGTGNNTEEIINIPVPLADGVSIPLKENKAVLLYVFAEGCSSCEAAEPFIEELAGDYSATVAYVKIDYYQYTDQVLEMGIKSTPTVWIISRYNTDGSFILAKRFDGSVEREELKSALDDAVKLLR